MLPHHGRYNYSVIDRRADYTWPEGKRLAFYLSVAVEHFAFGTGVAEDRSSGQSQWSGWKLERNYGWRDYGQRVGLWNLLAMLDALRLPIAHPVNSLIFRSQPQIAARIVARGDEIIAYGRTSSELQQGMWADDEADLIRAVTNTIAQGSGTVPIGWLSPGWSETAVTPDLLQEARYQYVLDWPADDQPFWLTTRSGRIMSVPYPLELNDFTAQLHRHHSARDFSDMIVNQFDEMIRQCIHRPLVCAIALHPYIVGQPFRLRMLRKALEHCVEHEQRERVWFTRPGEIARYAATLPPGVVPSA